MRIGITLGGVPSLEAQVQHLDEQVEQVVRAERDGFDSAWFTNIFITDALTGAAVAGAKTERIEIGTSVVPTYARHPFALAQQAMTVQAATHGRFTLGIGPSHEPVVEAMWGLSYDKPAKHVREYLTVLRSLVNEGRVAFNGEMLRATGALRVPGSSPFPILISALGPVMLRVAGELADGTVTWMTGPKTIESHIVPRMSAAAKNAGRPAPRVCVALPVAVTDDAAAARERAAQEFQMYGNLVNYRRMLDRESAAGPGDVVIAGNEAEVESQLRTVAGAGATDFAAPIFPVGDDANASIERTYALLKSLVGKV